MNDLDSGCINQKNNKMRQKALAFFDKALDC